MLIQVLRGKIHRAKVTDHNADYEGSLTLDRALMDRAGFYVHEKIAVWNVTGGQRFETYIIEGQRGSGEVCVNGAAAHLVNKGDLLIIASFGLVEVGEGAGWQPPAPRVVRVDSENRPLADDRLESASRA